MTDETSDVGSGLTDAGQRTREAAKYLIAAFGAVGAVLVSGLSLTALPSGRHPVIAAIAVLVAVLAIAFAINRVISVILPDRVTLSDLARLQQNDPDDKLINYLSSNAELFGGLGSNLAASRDRYLAAVDARAQTYDDYIEALESDSDAIARRQSASEVASARVQFLAPLAAQLLEVAALYRLQERFTRIRWPVAAAAVRVVGAVAVYAWASAAPRTTTGPKVVKELITKKVASAPNCVAYYLRLDRLADDEERAYLFHHKALFPLDRNATECGFTSRTQLTSFVAYLAGH